ncbi:DUF1566 domain-containing protein [Acinetobacter sp. VNH17]|uniref:DUF1566 domain-containing protein n=1 Tax=Acinetobacter thutiue TaxID=2998078 RepID=A0ABT7WNL9_9GAMM|nr:DUF1566 domain-containing protein [Acinetobacter thutiue]MCY6412154.1 DUF1566 domain-containing protein [Acinetobacter thutiue]MDN0014258.1 DUF1566 domain-containing protein [Acinetobacter thutiue]
MKRSLIYTAVFSAMMMVTGCGGGDGSSTSDDKGQSTQLDKTPIKQNQLYGANIDGIPSYYIDDGINKSSYFYDKEQVAGIVENNDGRTNFLFSDDFNELIVSNAKSNIKVEVKQINDDTVYQTLSDLNGNVLGTFAYFYEEGKIYLAPLNSQGQIDKTQKKDITQEYNSVVSQFEQRNMSVRSTVSQVFSSISATSKATFNEIMAARSPIKSRELDCGIVEDALDGKVEEVAKKVLVNAGKNVSSIFVTALGGYLLAGLCPPCTPVIVAVAKSMLLLQRNAEDYDNVISDNQQAFDNLNFAKKELDEWKDLDEWQTPPPVKEEPKQCLVGEVLVNGVCKKEEKKCAANENIVDGVCKKVEPICDVGETLVNGVCKKVEPICDVGEKLIDGVCEEERKCLINEKVVDGACITKDTTEFTKFNKKGEKIVDTWLDRIDPDCVLDNKTGLMWELEKTSHYSDKNVGFRSKDYRYSWGNGDYADPAEFYPERIIDNKPPYGESCGKSLILCNTTAYIAKMNSEKFCGYSDWRLPTEHEITALAAKINNLGWAVMGDYFSFQFGTPDLIWYHEANNKSKGWFFDSYNREKFIYKGGNKEEVAAGKIDGGIVAVRDAF